MKKFKKGDEVIFINREPIATCWKLGDVLIIDEVRAEISKCITIKNRIRQVVHEDQIEFEDVYNSPLYQALK